MTTKPYFTYPRFVGIVILLIGGFVGSYYAGWFGILAYTAGMIGIYLQWIGGHNALKQSRKQSKPTKAK